MAGPATNFLALRKRQLAAWLVFALAPGVLCSVLLAWGVAESAQERALSAGLATFSAAALIGSVGGFIFAVPRALAGESVNTTGTERVAFAVNSNLEKISDWVTTIVVGLTLVELRNIPDQFSRFGNWASSGIAESGARTVFTGLAAYGLAAGFFFAYVWSRLIFRVLLEQTERDAQDAAEMSRQQVESALGERVLTGSDAEDADRKAIAVQTETTAPDAAARDAEKLARELLQRVEREGPTKVDPSAARALARRLKGVGKYQLAADLYLAAFEADPSDPAPLNYAGVIMGRDLKDHDRAAALFRRALAIDPSYVSPLYNLACNEARKGRPDEALRLLLAAILANPDKYKPLARNDAADGGPFERLRDVPTFRDLVEWPADQTPPVGDAPAPNPQNPPPDAASTEDT
jgi:Flp pilus assembly protein TadD